MMIVPVPLPTRHSDSAPRFDPKNPLSLWEYFIDYEVLAEAAQLDEETKVKKSVIYLIRDEADLWESLDEYEGTDWQAFKNAVLSFYPGSIPKDRWTLNDLNEFIEVQKTKIIQTRGDFAEFHRQFATISKSLISKDLLSELEEKKLYWSTLDQPFKERLIRKVELTKPAYTAKTILTIAEIRDAADLVLDGTLAETSSATSQNATSSIPTPSLEPVKTESFDMERFTRQMSTIMAQTMETAIATVVDRAMSIPVIPAHPRNVPLVQKADNVHDRFSNIVTVASSNTNAIGTSTNLVNVRSVSPVETRVESKTDLGSYIAALQEMNAREDDDEKALEEIVRVLKTRVRKKKKTDGVSHQGPQEKRAVPIVAAPSIPAKVVVPWQLAPESAPVLVRPIRKASEQRQAPSEVIVQSVDAPEEVLGLTATLSVGELLALSPDVRKYFKEAVTPKQVERERPEKDLEQEGMTPYRRAFLVEENSHSGTVAACRNHCEVAHTTPSEPIQSSVEEMLVEEGIVVEKRNLKNCKEELSNEENLSHRRNVFDLFAEEDCPPLFSMFPNVIDSHRKEKSPMYSYSPHVKPLDTSLSMCSHAPPVLTGHSAIANPLRITPAESSVVAVDQEAFKTKDSRPHELKKLAPLLGDPINGEIVQIGSLRGALSLKSQNQPASLVEFAKPQPVNEAPTKCAAAFTQDEKKAYPRKSTPIVQLAQLIFQISILVLLFRYLFKLGDFKDSQEIAETENSQCGVLTTNVRLTASRNGELVQLEMSWIAVPACTHFETPSSKESLVYAQCPVVAPPAMFSSPHAYLVKFPAVSAATLFPNELSIAKFAQVSRGSPSTRDCRERVLEKVVPLPHDLESERLAQLRVSQIVVPARLHPMKPPGKEQLVFARSLRQTLLLKSKYLHESLVDLPKVLAATLSANESSLAQITHAIRINELMMECQERALKKTEPSPHAARSKGLARIGTFRIVIPCHLHPAKLPYEEEYALVQSPRLMLPSQSQNPSVCLVELAKASMVPQHVNEALKRRVAVFDQDEKGAYRRKPALSFAQFILQILVLVLLFRYLFRLGDCKNDQGSSETKRSRQVWKEMVSLLDDFRNGVSAQLKTSQVAVPDSVYLETLPNETSIVCTQSQESTFHSQVPHPHASLVEISTVVAATLLINGQSVVKLANAIQRNRDAKEYRERVLTNIASSRSYPKNGGLSSRLGTFGTMVPTRPHPVKSPNGYQLVYLSRHQTFISKSKNPGASLVELPTVFAATLSTNKPSTPTSATVVSSRRITRWEKNLLGVVPVQTRVDHRYPFIRRAQPSSFIFTFWFESLQAPFVECSTVFTAAPSMNKPLASSAAILVGYKKITQIRKHVPASFLDCHDPQPIFPVSLCIPQSLSSTLYHSIRCFDIPSDFRNDSRGSETKKSQRVLKEMVLWPHDAKHGESVRFEAFWMDVLAYFARLVKEESLVFLRNQGTTLLSKIEIPFVFVVKSSSAIVASTSRIKDLSTPNTAALVKYGKKARREEIILAETRADEYPFARPVHFPTQSPHVVFVEFSTVFAVAQPINGVPKFNVTIVASKIENHALIVPIQLSKFRPYHPSFNSTSSRLQARLVEFQSNTGMQRDVELKRMGLVGDIWVEAGWNVEMRLVVVVIPETDSGVCTLAETRYSEKFRAVSRCRPYHTRSLDNGVAKITGAEEDMAGTGSRGKQRSVPPLSLFC